MSGLGGGSTVASRLSSLIFFIFFFFSIFSVAEAARLRVALRVDRGGDPWGRMTVERVDGIVDMIVSDGIR